MMFLQIFAYQDKISGYIFVHIFQHELSDIKSLKKDEEKIKRRLKRLYATRNEKVAFVLNLRFNIEDEYLEELRDVIKTKWKNAKLFVVVFNSDTESDRVEDDLSIYRVKRVHNFYDYFQTNWVWRFLDCMETKEYNTFLCGILATRKIYKGHKIVLFPKISTLFCIQLFLFGFRLIFIIGKDKLIFREV